MLGYLLILFIIYRTIGRPALFMYDPPKDFLADEVAESNPIQAKESNQAEQASTGQPATRPESKSAGGVKPQPEAEGRSR